MNYRYHYDTFDAVNKARKDNNLPVIVRKKVKCLRCLNEFISLDYPRSRICSFCHKDDEFDPEVYGKVSLSIPFEI